MITRTYCVSIFNKMTLYSVLLVSSLVVSTRASDVPRSIVDAVQALEPNKSLISNYEIDQVPVESGVYFQSIVSGYNARVKRDVIAQLRQSVIHGDRNSKESLYLFEQLPTTKTVKQAMALLTRAISAHQTMIMQNAGHQDVIDRNDRVYAAILLQNCTVLTNHARDQFLTILDEINNSLMYWRDQKNHPTKYFFHKSPIKWIMGKSQVKEVADNIKKLEKLEHSVRDVLGKMIKHLYAFNPGSSVDETYNWVEQLLSIVSCIGTYDDKAVDSTRFDQLAQKLRFYIGRVGNLKSMVMVKVASAKKPSHLVRNWMAYTAAIAITYQAYNYYSGNADLVKARVEDALGSMGGVWKGVTDPVKDAWRTVFGGSVEAEDAKKLGLSQNFQKIEKIIPEFKNNKDILEKLINAGKPKQNNEVERKTFKEYALIDFESLLDMTWVGFGWTEDEKANIMKYAKEDNFKELRKVAESVSVVTNPNLKLGMERVTKELEFASILDSIPVLQNIIGNLVDIGWEAGEIVVYIIDRADALLKSNELTIKFAALIPAFGIGLGVGKMYSWLTARDYSSVRLALIAINSLFIEARAPLNDSDYGKLIYLLQGLKVKAMRYLPTQNNVRDDFLADIAKLESQQFTVEIKRRIIKNMFNKYPFLSLKEKTA